MVFAASLAATPAFALPRGAIKGAAIEPGIPAQLKDVGIQEHLGGRVSIDELSFADEDGRKILLKDYFHKNRPVLLVLNYYECGTLCSFVLNGVVKSLKTLDWTPGKQFEFVSVSINPRENPTHARAKKAVLLTGYGRPESAQGWHFLTGEEPQIKKLAGEIGFSYRYDEKEKQYAHGAAIFILTPEGKISRYLYGIEYSKKDMRLSLLEASSGKIGNVIDRFLLFCFRYNPETRKYSVVVTKVMQASSAGTVVAFGGYLMVFWRRQRRRESNPHV